MENFTVLNPELPDFFTVARKNVTVAHAVLNLNIFSNTMKSPAGVKRFTSIFKTTSNKF